MLVKGGRVVTPAGEVEADVRIGGERIMQVGPGLQPSDGEEIVDATSLFVLPGLIDPHTHFSLDTGSGRTADDFTSGSASVGTSVSGRRIEMDPGPILVAWADAFRKGRRLLRTLYVASNKAIATNGGTYQAVSKTNSRRMERTSWLPPETCATMTESGPAALSRRMPTPE